MCKAVKKLNQGQNFKRASEMTNNITLFTLQCENSKNISNFTSIVLFSRKKSYNMKN